MGTIKDGILDNSPRMWEMTAWCVDRMVAYATSMDGLDWRCVFFSLDTGHVIRRRVVYGKGRAYDLLNEHREHPW